MNRKVCPVCGEKAPFGARTTVKNAHLMFLLVESLTQRLKPGEEGEAARRFLAQGEALAHSLHDYAHRLTTVNPDWTAAGLWTRKARELDEKFG